MRTISAVVDIAATPQQVWAVLTDLDAYQDWKPFIQSASGQLIKGSTLRLRMVPEHGALTMRPRSLAVQPGALRWIGRLIMPGIFDGTHQFALDDLGGRTRLTQCETFRGALVPFTGSAITRTESDFRPFNQALKQRAEGNKGVASS